MSYEKYNKIDNKHNLQFTLHVITYFSTMFHTENTSLTYPLLSLGPKVTYVKRGKT